MNKFIIFTYLLIIPNTVMLQAETNVVNSTIQMQLGQHLGYSSSDNVILDQNNILNPGEYIYIEYTATNTSDAIHEVNLKSDLDSYFLNGGVIEDIHYMSRTPNISESSTIGDLNINETITIPPFSVQKIAFNIKLSDSFIQEDECEISFDYEQSITTDLENPGITQLNTLLENVCSTPALDVKLTMNDYDNNAIISKGEKISSQFEVFNNSESTISSNDIELIFDFDSSNFLKDYNQSITVTDMDDQPLNNNLVINLDETINIAKLNSNEGIKVKFTLTAIEKIENPKMDFSLSTNAANSIVDKPQILKSFNTLIEPEPDLTSDVQKQEEEKPSVEEETNQETTNLEEEKPKSENKLEKTGIIKSSNLIFVLSLIVLALYNKNTLIKYL